jgi:phage terminase large subunit-like protein
MARGGPALEDMTRGERVIAFCERYLVVPEGAHVGRPVQLRDWQKEIILGIYDRGQIRRAIISVARKNGKTSLIAMLVLAHLVGPESVPNSQIFSAAQSRDQAALVFNLAAKMVRMDVDLSARVTVRDTAKELFCIRTGVRYKALSADATTAYGLSPALVIFDELGQVRGLRSELYDALETAMGAQEEPLSIIISTQAPNDGDLLSDLIDKADQDPRTAVFLYRAEMGDDPFLEATWRKANPALGDFRSIDDMKDLAARARRMPSFEAAFRNLNLNQRVAAANHFLTPSVWEANGGAPDLSVLEDYPVYGGLDLSARQDLTALVLVARDAEGLVHIDPHFFAPAAGLQERGLRDRVPYDLWREQGLLTATSGRTVDYAWVAERLAEISGRYDLRAVRFDRWRIEDMRRELERIGCDVELEEHGQGFKDMSPAIDEVEALALNEQLRHGNNPILKWCAANSVVTRDAAGNRKLDKSKANGRIDGMVALAMALSGVMNAKPPGGGLSMYDNRGIFQL